MLKNNHEAIIPRENIYASPRRTCPSKQGHITQAVKEETLVQAMPFTDCLCGGNAGEIFRRVYWNNSGKKSIVWRCVSRLESTGLSCNARTVGEDILYMKRL